MLRRALAINREVFGEHHQRIASNLGALSLVRSAMGDGKAAVDYMRRWLEEYRRILGESHRNTLTTMGNLAFALAEFGDPVEAESLARASLARLDYSLAEHRAPLLNTELALGKSLLRQGRADDAAGVLKRVVQRGREQFGEGNWGNGEALLTYGLALEACGRVGDAGPLVRAARDALETNRDAQPRLAAQARAEARRLGS